MLPCPGVAMQHTTREMPFHPCQQADPPLSQLISEHAQELAQVQCTCWGPLTCTLCCAACCAAHISACASPAGPDARLMHLQSTTRPATPLPPLSVPLQSTASCQRHLAPALKATALEVRQMAPTNGVVPREGAMKDVFPEALTTLQAADPEVYGIIQDEKKRQWCASWAAASPVACRCEICASVVHRASSRQLSLARQSPTALCHEHMTAPAVLGCAVQRQAESSATHARAQWLRLASTVHGAQDGHRAHRV